MRYGVAFIYCCEFFYRQRGLTWFLLSSSYGRRGAVRWPTCHVTMVVENCWSFQSPGRVQLRVRTQRDRCCECLSAETFLSAQRDQFITHPAHAVVYFSSSRNTSRILNSYIVLRRYRTLAARNESVVFYVTSASVEKRSYVLRFIVILYIHCAFNGKDKNHTVVWQTSTWIVTVFSESDVYLCCRARPFDICHGDAIRAYICQVFVVGSVDASYILVNHSFKACSRKEPESRVATLFFGI